MVKEEKTIDGFPVRGVKDSALVARSKANKLPSNNAKKKVKTVTKNDPLVKKSTAKPLRNRWLELLSQRKRRGLRLFLKVWWRWI
ncbi:hypothetical protein IJG96_02345 [Candidatus Saccharibacteria bacterium]|nr:hypothetical protein [Candidatus Saccharibacteria bacterium]